MVPCIAWVLLLVPAEAWAGKFDETLELSLHTRVGSRAPTPRLRPRASSPAVIADADPRLGGPGSSTTGLFRIHASLHGFRFGAASGAEGYRGLGLGHEPLPSGVGLSNGRVFGIPLEGMVGYALPLEHVRPYVEARTTATFMVARARLRQADLGELGPVSLHAVAWSVATRAGVHIALNDYVFIDAGVDRVVAGSGRWAASVGIGIPIPFANL